jgi:hypothetical protein
VVLGFYQPKKNFVRGMGDDLDLSREGGGQLRDIVNKDGPMSSSKTKSVDFGKSGGMSEKDKPGNTSKVLELTDQQEI